MQKTFWLVIFCCTTINLQAQQSNNKENIVIENAVYKYSFEYNKKLQTVEVKEQQTLQYNTLLGSETIPIGEGYNDNTTIDKISIDINGKSAKWIVPKYEFLAQDNIFFSDQHICYFNVPLETKNAKATISFEKTIIDPRYFCQIFFDEAYTTYNKTIIITVPKWLQIQFKEFNFKQSNIALQVAENKNGDSVFTYTATNLKSNKAESNSLGPTYFLPHLMVQIKEANPNSDTKLTYFNTIADQYNWYKNIVSLLQTNKQIIKQQATSITNASKTNIDKIKDIFYWVQNNIRYLAFEDGIAGFKPDEAHEVLRKKYGDCKGMANLTKELLMAAGFDARLCWIGTNHIAHNYSTPNLSVDNHMICALVYEGKTYYLDATEKYIGFNEYAERIQGRQVLFENKATYTLSNVPNTSFTQNKDYEKRILTIDALNLKGTAEHEWAGEEKATLLYKINTTKKDNVKEAFTKFLADHNANYTITNLTTSNLDNWDKSISASYNIDYKNALSAFDKDLYIDVDFRKEFEKFDFDTSKRKTDYLLNYKYNIIHETEIALPTNATINSLPNKLVINNNNVQIEAQYTISNNKLFYKKFIRILNPVIKLTEMPIWNEGIKKLKDFYSQQIAITIK
jgi:hypothetical protein